MSKWTITIVWLIVYVLGCYMAYIAGRTNGMVEAEIKYVHTFELLLDASTDACAKFINNHCVCETRGREEER